MRLIQSIGLGVVLTVVFPTGSIAELQDPATVW